MLACAAPAAPAYAQDGGGPGNVVGRTVQQVADALPQLPLPHPRSQQQAPPQQSPAPVAPAPAAPSAPAPAAPVPAAPDAPAPAAPQPADPVAPAEPAVDRPAAESRDRAEAPPSPPAPQPSASSPAPKADLVPSERTTSGRDATSGRRHTGVRAKTSASGSPASQAGDGAAATGAQSGDPGSAAAQTGDPGAIAMADPVATGAQATEDSSGALPFTGSGVPLLAALGLLGLAAGLVIRRVTRAGA